MKGKWSLAIAAVLAAVAAIAKLQCGGTDTADNPVQKIIAAAIPGSILHDTIFIDRERIVYKTVIKIEPRDAYWTDTAIVLQQIPDSFTLAQLAITKDSLSLTKELLVDRIWSDSTSGAWGKARASVLLSAGEPLAWTLDVEPEPCPEPPAIVARNTKWAYGAGLSWNIPRNQPNVNLILQRGKIQALIQVNNKPGIQSVGVNYIQPF